MFSVPNKKPPPIGQRRRWFPFPRSFRGLVTAWNTVTILLFTVTILMGLRYGLSYTMLREEDKLLADDATEVCLLVDRVSPRWELIEQVLDRKADSHADRRWFGQVRTSNGKVLAQSRSVPAIRLTDADANVAGFLTIDSFRTSYRRHQAGSEPLIVYVGSSMDEIDEDLARLTQLIVIAAIALLIFAPLGGFWLAGRVIRPFVNIIESTASLRPSNIHERLPIRHTGDELDQLSDTINGLLDRIADYLARHRDLVANAAHELRSPLAAILTSAEVALNHDRPVDEYKELLGSIIEECTRLGTLVQQLLLLAESDAGRLERKNERVSLDAICLRAIEMFQGVAETKGVTLEARVLTKTSFVGDAGMLRQVVCNVIDNALKFTPQGSVVVEVKTGPANSGLIVVTDTGVGIPPENMPFIFDRFYRGDHARTRLVAGGSGLGLSICKALVTANGGTISVSSEVGVGTEVLISFPATSE